MAVAARAHETLSDHEILEGLNRDYIRSVETSDVRRFSEILAEDFLCSKPDGSLSTNGIPAPDGAGLGSDRSGGP